MLMKSGSIHLWFCVLNETIEPVLREKCEQILSPDEIKRKNRFHFEKHRLQFLISHAFLRIVLSQYQDCSPASLAYSMNENGKPFLSSQGKPGVSFNLSHTDGLACCAVARNGDIGVDVESIERQGKGDEISEQFFSSAEYNDMMAIGNEKTRRERFFHLWTLKEAFIKAKGKGLSLPLDLFRFDFLEKERINVTFDQKLDESPENWHFRLLQSTEMHRTAVAYKPESSNQEVSLKTFQTFPFCTEKEVFFPLLGTNESTP